MSFSSRGRHARHPTWPPTLQLLPNSYTNETVPSVKMPARKHYSQSLADVDEDPFAHFLSPVLDEEEADDDKIYAAGIDSPLTLSPRLSATKMSHQRALFRARLEEKWEGYVARRLLSRSPPFSAKTSPLSMSPLSTSPRSRTSSVAAAHGLGLSLAPPLPMDIPSTPPEEDSLPDLFLEDTDVDSDAATPSGDDEDYMSSPSPYFPSMTTKNATLDGWEGDRLRSKQPTTISRGRLQRAHSAPLSSTRTLSGKKHAWREPSEELWTVPERDDEDADARNEGKMMGRRKRNKMVHWADKVEVVEFER